MDKIDYASLAKSRYTNLFAKDKVFDAIIQTLVEYKMKTQDLYINFAKTILDIDKSTGNNLDLIGSIVGQPRVLVDFSIDKYFGFLGNPRAEPFDKGMWYSTFSTKGSDSRTLSDEEYRRIIKARIIRNRTNCNREDFMRILDLILDTDSFKTYENVMPNSQFNTYTAMSSEITKSNNLNISKNEITRVTAKTNIVAPKGFYIANDDTRMKLEVGKEYTISMKASSGTGQLVTSLVFDGSAEAINVFNDVPVSTDRENPTLINHVFTVDKDLSHFYLVIGSIGKTGEWFEFVDVMIREGVKDAPINWEPSRLEVPTYTIESKTHGNIDLNVYNYKGDLGIHFLSNYEKTGDLIPKPMGYKLSVMIH